MSFAGVGCGDTGLSAGATSGVVYARFLVVAVFQALEALRVAVVGSCFLKIASVVEERDGFHTEVLDFAWEEVDDAPTPTFFSVSGTVENLGGWAMLKLVASKIS